MNSEVNNVLFIVNKFAGSGFQPALEGKIIEACGKHNAACTIAYTEGSGHATELSENAVRSNAYGQIVAVGGDGTVNEVARGMLHSSIPMGIIPRGSGNGLARHLRIAMNVPGALKNLFNSQLIGMDTFQVNGKLSLNVSGIGFDGHIANLFGSGKKRGLQGYARHTVNEFFRFKEFKAEIQTERETIQRDAFVIAIANSSQYGNNARIAPAASVCDQLLHISILKKIPLYRFDFIYSFFAGKVDRTSYCETLETGKLTVRLDSPVAYHIDGEPGGTQDQFDIALLPASLKILVPRETINP